MGKASLPSVYAVRQLGSGYWEVITAPIATSNAGFGGRGEVLKKYSSNTRAVAPFCVANQRLFLTKCYHPP